MSHRSVTRPAAIAWVGSLAIHAVLLFLIASLTGAIDLSGPTDQPKDDDTSIPPVIQAQLQSLTYSSEPSAEGARAEDPIPPPPVMVPKIAPDPALEALLSDLRSSYDAASTESASLIDDVLTDPSSVLAPEVLSKSTAAAFGGVRSSNARRIAFVIDGSGSMVPYLQNVLSELDRALESLSEEQFFAVLFFQGNGAVVAPPEGRLTLATARNVDRAIEWVHGTIVPRGRSNPLEALRRAMALRPDVIFLMSENITGAGEFEIPHEELLSYLDRLNPLIPGSDGRRRVRINCIQFLEPSEQGTLRAIAEQHGGSDGYAEMSRRSLGLGG